MFKILSIAILNTKLKDWAPAAICFVSSFMFLVILNFAPTGGARLAVIYPFGMMSDESFANTINSGAYATGEGMFENIILFTTVEQNPEIVIDKLYKNGALVVINGLWLGGCFSYSK